jgi:hypothetical protein
MTKENNMNLNENLKMNGEVSIVVTGSDGAVKQELVVPNLVVTVGKKYIAARMSDTPADAMSHMAIGAGTTAPDVSDTVMESNLHRSVLTSITAVDSVVVTAVATFAAGDGTGAVTEAAIFNAASGGTMLCHTTFPVVNKEVGDSISITWAITVS